jgi:signal peptidase II
MSDETEPKPLEPAEGATEAPEPAADSPQTTPASEEAPTATEPDVVEPTGPTPDDIATLRRRPTYVFFGVLAGLSLLADIFSKAWAEVVLSKRTALDPGITLVKDHLSFTLAYNKGGAWGLLHDASENVRRPFFLLVSVLAIAFIVSLYSRLSPAQRALKWGLPLVLGGALGNLSDRITRSSVIDFIDYRADWIEKMNHFIAKYAKGWAITDHWPTFNVADVFICIGVALMAVDMATSRRKPPGAPATPVKEIEPQPKVEAPPAAVPSEPPPEAPPATG